MTWEVKHNLSSQFQLMCNLSFVCLLLDKRTCKLQLNLQKQDIWNYQQIVRQCTCIILKKFHHNMFIKLEPAGRGGGHIPPLNFGQKRCKSSTWKPNYCLYSYNLWLDLLFKNVQSRKRWVIKPQVLYKTQGSIRVLRALSVNKKELPYAGM